MSAAAFALCLEAGAREAHPAARIAVEAIAVVEGLKPAARFTASRGAAKRLIAMIEAAGMIADIYVPTPAEWGYRHATEGERAAASARDVRVYFAASESALREALEAQKRRDDLTLGLALGYPPCCIAMNDMFGALPMTDMVRVGRSRGAHDWRLNIFLTEMEIGLGSPYYLVSHFPCSLACAPSIAYAEALHRALQRHAPRFAVTVADLLTRPVLLRDEREPPDERRYGNFGGLLDGGVIGDNVFFRRWRSLRSSDRLAAAALDDADMIVDEGDRLLIMRSATQEVVARLESDRWRLVTF